MTEPTPSTILILEDVEEIRENMKDALNKRGYDVIVAGNLAEAIEMADGNRPVMILTDLDLPDFDNLLQLLREHHELKNMVVAVIDIDHPNLADKSVRVLGDFNALDDLITSIRQSE